MNDMTIFEQGNAQLPAAMQNQQVDTSEMSEGVLAGFPILSFRGKVWRMKKGDEQVTMVDDKTGDPLAGISVVLIAANQHLSKIYYENNYEEGSNAAPDCFSVNGDVPDSSVENPVHASCSMCPKNAWGSRITDTGKKTKACADNRRVAVAFLDGPDSLAEKGADANVFLLRIPGASLSNLKIYAEKVLGERGWPFYAVVTRIGFDADASYPQLTFRPLAPISNDVAEAVLALRDSDIVKTITSAGSELVTPQDAATSNNNPPTGDNVTPIAPPAESPQATAAASEPQQQTQEGNPPAATTVPDEPATPPPAPEPQVASQADPAEPQEAAQEPEEGSDDALKQLLGGLDEDTA